MSGALAEVVWTWVKTLFLCIAVRTAASESLCGSTAFLFTRDWLVTVLGHSGHETGWVGRDVWPVELTWMGEDSDIWQWASVINWIRFRIHMAYSIAVACHALSIRRGNVSGACLGFCNPCTSTPVTAGVLPGGRSWRNGSWTRRTCQTL